MSRAFFGFALGCGLVLLAITGCSSSDNDEGGTGIQAVDAAIEAILAGDGASLARQAVFTKEACTTADGLGGPPKCALDETEGTQVSVMPAASCEGFYLREGELAPSAEGFVSGEVRLHGVYGSGGMRNFIEGDYVILLAAVDPRFDREMAREAYVDDRGVTGLFFGCGQSVEELISAHELRDEIDYSGSPD